MVSTQQSLLNVNDFSFDKIKSAEVVENHLIINGKSTLSIISSSAESAKKELLRIFETFSVYLHGKLNYREPKSIMDNIIENKHTLINNINVKSLVTFNIIVDTQFTFDICEIFPLTNETLDYKNIIKDELMCNDGYMYAFYKSKLYDTFSHTELYNSDLPSDKLVIDNNMIVVNLGLQDYISFANNINLTLVPNKSYTLTFQIKYDPQPSIVITNMFQVKDTEFEIVSINKKEVNIKITRQDLIDKYPESKNDLEKLFTEDQILHEKTIDVLESIDINMTVLMKDIDVTFTNNAGVLTIPRNENFVAIEKEFMLSDKPLTSIEVAINKNQMIEIIDKQELKLKIHMNIDKTAKLINVS